MERQDRDGGASERSIRGDAVALLAAARRSQIYAEDMDRISNVLNGYFAEIDEIDHQLVSNAGVNDVGNEDATRLANAFESRGDIHTVAKNIIAVDNYVA